MNSSGGPTVIFSIPLDIPTLQIVGALSMTVCGAVLLVAQDSRTDNESLRTWGLAILLVAMALTVSVSGAGDVRLSTGLSTSMVLMARGMGWSGARRFNGKVPMVTLSIAGGLAWVLLVPFVDVMRWLVVPNVISAVYIGAMLWELWPGAGDKLRSRRLLLILLAWQLVTVIVRAGLTLAAHGAGPWAESLMKVIVLEGVLNSTGSALLLLALVKEQVEQTAVSQMHGIAMKDGLTGVSNRRHFDEVLREEIRRGRRQMCTVSLLMIDVDHFKHFNDDHGHQEGDRCLRLIAQTIAGLVRRPGDLLARYGGEEFAVLLPETDGGAARGLAERIRRAVQVATEAGAGRTVTVSIGVATSMPTGDEDGDALVAAADMALYAAKGGGRDMVCGAEQPEPARALGNPA